MCLTEYVVLVEGPGAVQQLIPNGSRPDVGLDEPRACGGLLRSILCIYIRPCFSPSQPWVEEGGCTWCILITARSLFFSRLPKGSRAAGVAGRYSVVGDNSDLSFNDPVGTDPVVSNDSVKFPKYLK